MPKVHFNIQFRFRRDFHAVWGGAGAGKGGEESNEKGITRRQIEREKRLCLMFY